MDINIKLCNLKNIDNDIGKMPKDLANEIQEVINTKKGQLPLETILKLARWKYYKTETSGLHKFLQDATFILPEPILKPRSPDLDQRILELRNQQDQWVYNKMVSNIVKPVRSQQKKQAPMISGFNFAVTLVASVFATVYVLSAFVPNFALRVAIGLVVGTILLVVEVLLAVRAVQKQEDEEEKANRTHFPTPNK